VTEQYGNEISRHVYRISQLRCKTTSIEQTQYEILYVRFIYDHIAIYLKNLNHPIDDALTRISKSISSRTNQDFVLFYTDLGQFLSSFNNLTHASS